MAMRIFGGQFLYNKMTHAEIIGMGRLLDNDIACGKRAVASLDKDERRAWMAYKQTHRCNR